jgi:23S rRNA pseudouridine1911/1915/1917 synthase
MFKTQYHGDIPTRIDKFLAEFLHDISRQQIQILIKNNLVSKNGQIITKPKELVSIGDIIEVNTIKIKQKSITMDDSIKKDLATQVQIIFEHPDFLIVNKPAGLLMHKTNNINSYSLVDILISQYPEIKQAVDPEQNSEAIAQNRYGIVHRIDKDTSGLVIIARNQNALINLKKLFKDRQVYKEYICLVRGIVKNDYGNITYPIMRSKLDHTKRVAVISDKKSRATQRTAHSEYWVLERYQDSTLLKVVIHTGRTHQIRVHMQSIGHPIIGDKLYGGKLERKDKSSLNRQFLHASKLKFKYYSQEYEFSSNLPDNLTAYKSAKPYLSTKIK